MSHTPGPWTVGSGSVGAKAVFAGNRVIAPAPQEIRSHKEAEANARLIAAAPALVEALQFVVDACVRLNDAGAVAAGIQDVLTEELDDIENVVHDALTLAKGE